MLKAGSRCTVNSTAPSNSRSIRTSSSAIRRRSFLMSLIIVSAGLPVVGRWVKLSRIASKRGADAVGLRVERASGIQNRPPPIQLTPKCTSRRFGSLEKSKDRSKASSPPVSGSSVSADILRVRIEGTVYYGCPPCTTASRGSRHTPPRVSRSREDTRTCCESVPR